MAERSLQPVPEQPTRAVAPFNEDRELIRRTFAKNLHDDEFELYIATAAKLGLSIISRELYAIVYNADNRDKRTVVFQSGIDGYRKVAARSGEYLGQDGPYWCGQDGEWKDVWLASEPPVAAKVGVWRRGFVHPVYAVANMAEYRGNSDFWRSKPALMLAKCAEAAAIRKSFADFLAGTYTVDEMAQAGGIEVEGRVVDPTTGVIEERSRADRQGSSRPPRQQRQAPPKASADELERQKADQILSSIRQIGAKLGFDLPAVMDVAVLDMAPNGRDDVRELTVAELSKIHADMLRKQKADPGEFTAWIDSVWREYRNRDAIDVEAVEVPDDQDVRAL